MSGQQEVRIFARTSDGRIRRAMRYHNSPGWIWIYEGESEARRLGDITVSFPDDVLPTSAADFAAALGFSVA